MESITSLIAAATSTMITIICLLYPSDPADDEDSVDRGSCSCISVVKLVTGVTLAKVLEQLCTAHPCQPTADVKSTSSP